MSRQSISEVMWPSFQSGGENITFFRVEFHMPIIGPFGERVKVGLEDILVIWGVDL